MQSATSAARLVAALGLALAAAACSQPAGGPAAASGINPNRSCVDALAGYRETSRFTAALSRTHVGDELRQIGPFTIFAPTDTAISRVNSVVIERAFPMVSGGREMDVVLGPASANAHIVDGRFASDTLPAGLRRSGRTRAGNQISVISEGGTITVTGAGGATAKVIRADIPCSNGVIHLIDGVLFR